MSEQPKQAWRIEIGKMGNHCRIFLNGEPVYPCAADLHMEAGQPTTLRLQFPRYGQSEARFQQQDDVEASGTPKYTYIEIGDRRFRVIEDISAGAREDGLFSGR